MQNNLPEKLTDWTDQQLKDEKLKAFELREQANGDIERAIGNINAIAREQLRRTQQGVVSPIQPDQPEEPKEVTE